MNDALQIAATGLHAQQLNVDTIANNLANVSTTGFKKARVTFQDMMYREVARSAANPAAAEAAATLGSGVAVGSTQRLFGTGELKQTDQPLDVAIRGDGFVEVAMPDGTTAYTRGGSLIVNKDGLLATAQGYPLKASIHIPADATGLTVANDGRMLVVVASQKDATEVGRLELARFNQPGALAPLGDGIYKPTEASGEPRTGKAGEDGFGTFAQGFTEASNVKLVEEMVELMIAQRAYEVSTKVVQASDELMSMTNNLRK